MLYTGAGIIMDGSDATAKVGAEFRARNWWLIWSFRAVVFSAILFDVLLVEWFKVSSISLRTWVATELHPTLIDGGIVATLIVCYLLRQSWPDVAFMAFLGATICSPTSSNPFLKKGA